MDTLNKKIITATKWSSLTELISRLITPISSMILARILAPEVFGIVASVNVVLSFCEIFTDAGFQKYIVQHEVNEKKDIYIYANIAFWTNFILSVLIWFFVIVFSDTIAQLVGCEGKGLAISVACVNLPLISLSSIQSALLKREMNFRPMFYIKLVTILIPIVLTIPLAWITKSYWAMIIGTISINFTTVLFMFRLNQWRPRLTYSLTLLRQMLTFSIWSMIESILVWVINWGDVFIVGGILSSYYLGLYKVSINIVNQIFGVISMSIVPVLLSALSRVQNNQIKFKEIFYKFSFFSSLLLIPMGVGIYIFKETICMIALGPGWEEAETLIGMWGLISSLAIVFNSFNSNVLIAKGVPKISTIVQIIQILFIIPVVYVSANSGFLTLSYARALVRIVGMIIYSIEVRIISGISMFYLFRRLVPVFAATFAMSVFGFWYISLDLSLFLNIIGVFLCIILYFIVLFIFPSIRNQIEPYFKSRFYNFSKKNRLYINGGD